VGRECHPCLDSSSRWTKGNKGLPAFVLRFFEINLEKGKNIYLSVRSLPKSKLSNFAPAAYDSIFIDIGLSKKPRGSSRILYLKQEDVIVSPPLVTLSSYPLDGKRRPCNTAS
jgi:hypothetical protein